MIVIKYILIFFVLSMNVVLADPQTCQTNDDCPARRACVGARVEQKCIENPLHTDCNECVSKGVGDVPVKTLFFVDNGNQGLVYFDVECLKVISINEIVDGICVMNSMAAAFCHLNTIVKGEFIRYFVLIAIFTFGIHVLLGKFNPNELWTLLVAIGLVYGSYQIVAMITKENTETCQNIQY